MKHFIALLIGAALCCPQFVQSQHFTHGDKSLDSKYGTGTEAAKAARITQAKASVSQSKKGLSRSDLQKKFSLPRYEFGLTATASWASLSHLATFQLQNNQAFLQGTSVGSYTTESFNNRYRTNIFLGETQHSLIGNQPPSSYETAFTSSERQVFYTVQGEIRRVRDLAGKGPRGYFFTLGATFVNDYFEQYEDFSRKLFFIPVGAGFIIPGEENFHAEIAAHGFLSGNGMAGGKFDFSVVVGPLKFGPSFTIFKVPGAYTTSVGTPGIHVGFIPKF